MDRNEIIKIMEKVSQIERDIKKQDGPDGTLRPSGPSRGRLYERLGIFLVAMCQSGVHPTQAVELVGRMATMPEESIDYLSLLGSIQMVGDEPLIFPVNLKEQMEC